MNKKERDVLKEGLSSIHKLSKSERVKNYVEYLQDTLIAEKG